MVHAMRFKVNHTYNEGQIEWFRAGSALNLIKLSLKENELRIIDGCDLLNIHHRDFAGADKRQ